MLKISIIRAFPIYIVSILLAQPLKILFELSFDFPYQIFSFFELIIPTIFVFIYRKKLKAVPTYYFFIFGALTLYFLFYIFISIFSVNQYSNLVQISYSYFNNIRILSVACIFFILKIENINIKLINKFIFIFVIYFTLVALIQNPYISSAGSELLSNVGGNITSRNAFFFRSNGGIGGNVIDFATLLIILTFYFVGRRDYNFKSYSIIFAIIICLFLSFSRSSILLFCLYFLTVKLRRKSIFLVTFMLSMFYFIYNDSDVATILYNYDEMVGHSDESRLNGWSHIFTDFSSIDDYIFGKKMGANTGFYLNGTSKVMGDGSLFTYYYDYGIFGILFLFASFISVIFSSDLPYSLKWPIFICTFFLLIINSGLEKNLVYSLFIYALLSLSPKYYSYINEK